MPALELLPADKRAKILATLADIEPMTNVQVLNGVTKGTIGLRLQRRLLGQENEIERRDAELERLRTGETCVVGMPMSCGDAHTAGHCVRVISQQEREAVAEVHRLRTKHNDWTRDA
jgi:hypothetical protein